MSFSGGIVAVHSGRGEHSISAARAPARLWRWSNANGSVTEHPLIGHATHLIEVDAGRVRVGCSSTASEISKITGISRSTTQDHVSALADKHHLVRQGAARSTCARSEPLARMILVEMPVAVGMGRVAFSFAPKEIDCTTKIVSRLSVRPPRRPLCITAVVGRIWTPHPGMACSRQRDQGSRSTLSTLFLRTRWRIISRRRMVTLCGRSAPTCTAFPAYSEQRSATASAPHRRALRDRGQTCQAASVPPYEPFPEPDNRKSPTPLQSRSKAWAA
jgi:hypothetical protein